MNNLSWLRASVLLGSCLVALAGCGDDGDDFDISQQIGPDPVLPEPDPDLFPDLKVAEIVGWQEGEVPAVPEGLAVTAYATRLGPSSSRSLTTAQSSPVSG